MRTNNSIISKKKSFMEYTNIEVFLLTTLKLFNNAIGLEMVVSFAPPFINLISSINIIVSTLLKLLYNELS